MTREQVVEIVAGQLAGHNVEGIQFEIDTDRVREESARWLVPISIDREPRRWFAIYEELAVIEEELEEIGFKNISVCLGKTRSTVS